MVMPSSMRQSFKEAIDFVRTISAYFLQENVRWSIKEHIEYVEVSYSYMGQSDDEDFFSVANVDDVWEVAHATQYLAYLFIEVFTEHLDTRDEALFYTLRESAEVAGTVVAYFNRAGMN